MPTYAYPVLSPCNLYIFRLFGPGLGNLLFPWARCIVFARKNNHLPIWPTWPQLKVGPWFRGEADKRTYHKFFFRAPNYVGGLEKAGALLMGERIPEPSHNEILNFRPSRKTLVVTFSGIKNLFSDLLGNHEMIRKELLDIVRAEHTRGLRFNFSGSISVHARLGDFLESDQKLLHNGGHNVRLSIDWYVDTIRYLRAELGRQIPVWLFSNGSDDELSKLLDLPDVKRLTFDSAIADMLALSRARILVASSTFSMWAAFLGRMPVIWHRGQLKQRLHLHPSSALETERDIGENLREEFLVNARKALVVEAFNEGTGWPG